MGKILSSRRPTRLYKNFVPNQCAWHRGVRLTGDTSMIRLVDLAQQLPRAILPAPLQCHQDWLHEPVSARPSLATAMLKPSVQKEMLPAKESGDLLAGELQEQVGDPCS
ncbi:hypothetical protein TWF970_000294 [Orbilia oligospora]|uniref:Uncharacterized protein n=1 Tax=Orbilia oligospora TaxID=2813651 RepID=A0A7C8RQZ0_ORBOL|nr:hypothetical protein TWF970_000294 [Orbilia oligospora]